MWCAAAWRANRACCRAICSMVPVSAANCRPEGACPAALTCMKWQAMPEVSCRSVPGITTSCPAIPCSLLIVCRRLVWLPQPVARCCICYLLPSKPYLALKAATTWSCCCGSIVLTFFISLSLFSKQPQHPYTEVHVWRLVSWWVSPSCTLWVSGCRACAAATLSAFCLSWCGPLLVSKEWGVVRTHLHWPGLLLLVVLGK